MTLIYVDIAYKQDVIIRQTSKLYAIASISVVSTRWRTLERSLYTPNLAYFQRNYFYFICFSPRIYDISTSS